MYLSHQLHHHLCYTSIVHCMLQDTAIPVAVPASFPAAASFGSPTHALPSSDAPPSEPGSSSLQHATSVVSPGQTQASTLSQPHDSAPPQPVAPALAFSEHDQQAGPQPMQDVQQGTAQQLPLKGKLLGDIETADAELACLAAQLAELKAAAEKAAPVLVSRPFLSPASSEQAACCLTAGKHLWLRADRLRSCLLAEPLPGLHPSWCGLCDILFIWGLA